MHNRIIHNLAILITAGVLVLVVSMATFMGARAYYLSKNAKEINEAVEISASICELAASSNSEEDLINKINSNVGKTTESDNGYRLNYEDKILFTIAVEENDKSNGKMLEVNLVSYKGDTQLYSLNTEKYVSGRKAGDA
ncbi:MAG: hypothetical protein GX852_02935 [Clostridiales bacterium]|jgi:hypothetical protein|nr:hypothetical protein [Clostridiales bacterium]